jgi:hypothetical protein
MGDAVITILPAEKVEYLWRCCKCKRDPRNYSADLPPDGKVCDGIRAKPKPTCEHVFCEKCAVQVVRSKEIYPRKSPDEKGSETNEETMIDGC